MEDLVPRLMSVDSRKTITHIGTIANRENSCFYAYHDIVLPNYEHFLAYKGVKLPSWGTQGAVALGLLAVLNLRDEMIETKPAVKILRDFGYESYQFQELRHLHLQCGFNIEQYSQLRARGFMVKRGTFFLVNLTEPAPEWNPERRDGETQQHLSTPCERCKGQAGDTNPLYHGVIQFVSETHCHPGKPLTEDNSVLLCDICNRTLQNKFILDQDGQILSRYTPTVARSLNGF